MKKNRTFTNYFLLPVIALSLSGMLFYFQGVQRAVVSCVVYPFLWIEHSLIAPIKRWSCMRQGAHDLHTVAQQLAQERDELRARVIELEAQLGYIRDCRELLEFKKRYASESLVVPILLKNFSSQGHFFLVHAGLCHGVKKDMVAVYKNNLVGRVVEVYPLFSKILLITDCQCHVAARCAKMGAQGIHSGAQSVDYTHLNFVDHLKSLQEGDLVLSHGSSLIFPRGFALGVIESYALDGVNYSVKVRPLIDFEQIEFCTVLFA